MPTFSIMATPKPGRRKPRGFCPLAARDLEADDDAADALRQAESPMNETADGPREGAFAEENERASPAAKVFLEDWMPIVSRVNRPPVDVNPLGTRIDDVKDGRVMSTRFDYGEERGEQSFEVVVGGAVCGRIERRKVLALAQRRKIDAVLVTELSRWGRSTTDLLATLKEPEGVTP